MYHLLNPAHSLPDVLFDYLSAGFGAATAPVQIAGHGMPTDTVHLPTQSAILSFTCVAAPMFRAKVEALAAAQSLDVVLVRCCLTTGDILPVSVDLTLAGGGLAPFAMYDLAPYRHDDNTLWLVPTGFGGAVRLEAHGFELYLTPPYETLIDRAQGIYRTAEDLAALLYPQHGC